MITLRRTNSEDADFQKLVVELDKDLAIRDGDEHSFYAQFNKIDAIDCVVVAYKDELAVGCGAIKPFSEGVIEVKRMFVPEESRGLGIASRVLRELEMWAAESKAQRCILETGKKQPEAIRLYEKHGYSLMPNYGQYKGVENSVCFEKILPARPSVIVRAGSNDDAESLAKLGRETFHEAFSGHPLMPEADLNEYIADAFTVSQVAGEIADRHAQYLIAEIDDAAVGYAKLEFDKTAPGVTGEPMVKLKRIYLKQSVAGKGVGAALMKTILDEVERRAYNTLWLTVWEHNVHAQGFYRKWGFEACGFIDFPLGSVVMTDLLMQRKIDS